MAQVMDKGNDDVVEMIKKETKRKENTVRKIPPPTQIDGLGLTFN